MHGCFTLVFNHMLLFGQLWHATARSLISREDDSWVKKQLVNQGIKISRVLSVALGFAHLCISESRGRSRDAVHPTGEIGSYISRENIL